MSRTLISFNRSDLKLFCPSPPAFTAGLRSIMRATSMAELLNSVGVDGWVSGYAFHSLCLHRLYVENSNPWPHLTFCLYLTLSLYLEQSVNLLPSLVGGSCSRERFTFFTLTLVSHCRMSKPILSNYVSDEYRTGGRFWMLLFEGGSCYGC